MMARFGAVAAAAQPAGAGGGAGGRSKDAEQACFAENGVWLQLALLDSDSDDDGGDDGGGGGGGSMSRTLTDRHSAASPFRRTPAR